MKIFDSMVRVSLGACVALSMSVGTAAADWEWWPNDVEDLASREPKVISYSPRMDAPSKKWNICILLPHLKDTWWVGIAAGAMQEAERQGIKASLFQAGGYTEFNKHLSQFDDCMALGVDAILIAAVSEGALKPKIEEAKKRGIKLIAVGNPVSEVPVDTAVFGDYNIDAGVAGRALVAHYEAMGKDKARVVNFSGVAGAGWAEQAVRGWTEAFDGTIVELVENKYGETDKSTQLKLVEDTIQTYDDIDAYVGVAVMAEVAPDVLEEAGMSGEVDVLAFYMSEGALNGIKDGTVLGVASNPMVVEAAVAVDLAVRMLEGEQVSNRYRLPPVWIDKNFVETQDMTKFTPPANWDIVYTVD